MKIRSSIKLNNAFLTFSLNHYRLEAGRLKSWLEAGNHSKECSSLQRDVVFIVRLVRIDMAIDVGIDHLMGHNDGEKPCDYLCCTRSLRSDVHQIGLRFNVVMAS